MAQPVAYDGEGEFRRAANAVRRTEGAVPPQHPLLTETITTPVPLEVDVEITGPKRRDIVYETDVWPAKLVYRNIYRTSGGEDEWITNPATVFAFELGNAALKVGTRYRGWVYGQVSWQPKPEDIIPPMALGIPVDSMIVKVNTGGSTGDCKTGCPVWYTAYHHLSAAAVSVGDHLTPRQLVGAVGKFTDLSAHLHFSLGDGSAFLVTDPEIVCGQTQNVEDWLGYDIIGTRPPLPGPLYYPPEFTTVASDYESAVAYMRCVFSPPVDPADASWVLFHGSLQHKDGEYYANDIYPISADPLDPDESTMLGTLVYNAVNSAEVDSEVIYAAEINPSVGYMVIVKHQRKVCIAFTRVGCGLKVDDTVPGKILVDAEAIAGDGLLADPLEDCKLKVFPGCGVYIDEDGRVAADLDDDINSLVTPARPMMSGIKVYHPTDGSCPYFYIFNGCGLLIDNTNKLYVDAEALAGDGLLFDELTECKIKVYPGCGIYIMETGQVAVDLPEIINTADATAERPITSGLAVYEPNDGSCPYLYVNPGCGIKVDGPTNKVTVDWETILYADSALEYVDVDESESCPFRLRVKFNCGLKLNDDGELEVDVDNLAGTGLGVEGSGCKKLKVQASGGTDVDIITNLCITKDPETGAITDIKVEKRTLHIPPWMTLGAPFCVTLEEDPCCCADELSVVGMVDDADPDVDQLLSFTATPSGGVAPYTYAWDFGDGGTSTDQNPTHAYTAAGVYTVTVTVTDACGNTATDTVEVTVSEPAPSSVPACWLPSTELVANGVRVTGSFIGVDDQHFHVFGTPGAQVSVYLQCGPELGTSIADLRSSSYDCLTLSDPFQKVACASGCITYTIPAEGVLLLTVQSAISDTDWGLTAYAGASCGDPGAMPGC